MSVESVLKKYRKVIIYSIDESSNVYEQLYSNSTFTEKQYQNLCAQNTQLEKATKLVDLILLNGKVGFFRFCEALKEEYDWIYKDLINEAKLHNICEDGNNLSSTGYCTPIPQEILNLIPTERQLMRISRAVMISDWKDMLHELGLSTSTIEQCSRGNSCEQTQCKTALIMWLRQEGENATFAMLIKAIEDAEMPHKIVEQLIKIAQIN